MDIDTVVLFWIGTVLIIVPFLIGYTIYSYYAIFRIYHFLKKNNPERLAWLRAKDLNGWGWHQGFANRDRGIEWLNNEMDNEYDIIRNLKNRLKNYGRYGYYSILYIFVSAILIIIVKMLGMS